MTTEISATTKLSTFTFRKLTDIQPLQSPRAGAHMNKSRTETLMCLAGVGSDQIVVEERTAAVPRD